MSGSSLYSGIMDLCMNRLKTPPTSLILMSRVPTMSHCRYKQCQSIADTPNNNFMYDYVAYSKKNNLELISALNASFKKF